MANQDNNRNKTSNLNENIKNNVPTIIISILTIIVIAGLSIFAFTQNKSKTVEIYTDPTKTPPTLGSDAVDFTLSDLENKEYSLSKLKGNKAVVIEFFAVWCPHCQRETQVMNPLYEKYKDKGVEFLNIQGSQLAMDQRTNATLDDLKAFRDQFGVKYPILQDSKVDTANKYGIGGKFRDSTMGFPAFYFIDKSGKITYVDTGEQSEESLDAEIAKIATN